MNSSVVSFSLNVLLKLDLLSQPGVVPTPEFGTSHTWNFDIESKCET